MIRNLGAIAMLMVSVGPVFAADIKCVLQSESVVIANPRVSVLVHCRTGTIPYQKILAPVNGPLPEIRQQQEQAEIAATPASKTFIYQCPRLASGYSCKNPTTTAE